MTDRGKDQPPFDERAALGELERFRADIERYRKQRHAVSDDFEAFVRAFRSPVDVFPSEQTKAAAAAPVAREPAATSPSPAQGARPVPPADRASPPPADRATPRAAPADPARPKPPVGSGSSERRDTPAGAAPAVLDSRDPAPAPPAREAVRPPATATAGPASDAPTPSRTRKPLAAVLVLLLIAAGVGVWMLRGGQPSVRTPAPSGQAAEPATPPDSAAAPAPSPAAPAPTESEITTIRRAWVRVIADGERVLERELPADTRVPFTADKTIVIRTGDAGAVRLSIRGADQGVLGRDGDVVTRSFTVPARPPR